MNPVVEEMNDILIHYGMPRRSGRYPWGSGENPYQHSIDFLGRIETLKKSGWSETPENIKNEFGLTTTQYRAQKSLAKDERRMYDVARAKSLSKDGLGPTEIGKIMGINESSVRSLLDSNSESRMLKARETADFIKKQIDTKGMIMVGAGIEHELNISKEKLNTALALLEAEGYVLLGGRVPQVTNSNQQTTIKVIAPPDTPYRIDDKGRKVSAAVYDFDNIHTLNEYISRDGGDTFEKKFHYPESMDSNRLMIRYKEDGGELKDGIVELRRGVPDLSLGNSHYSQVRILVDNDKFIKGMAVYSDAKDWPDGVDVIFNTNKSNSVPKLDVLKKIKDDPDNPFGSLIKDADQGGQYWYNDPKTGEKKLGLINKRADEGDWTDWKDTLPSQFLSKQTPELAKKQLGLAITDKTSEFNEICEKTNPTVKKYLLNKFAEECDSAAVHLKAAALPGQKYHVIVPINSLKDNEIYAPGYKDGTELALIRYPHGGTFEIPVLKVNNKNPIGKEILGNTSIDAVGINKKNADRLSGADFDGDTVMCIPTNNGKVKILSTHELKGLEGFDPKTEYGGECKVDSDGSKHYYRNGKEYKVMSEHLKQVQMGVVSNLITDMTLKGATEDELARAVRHSMVVIDAEKHKLDYRQSELDNNISALKKDYQTYVDKDGKVHTGGASTLISRAKSEERVTKRQGSPIINMKTKNGQPNPDYDPTRPEGALIWKKADDATYEKTKVNKKTGEVTTTTVTRTQGSTRMAETDDAYTLVSDSNTRMEHLYADYANSMKSLANQARKEMMNTGKVPYNPKAKETYKAEVASLKSKLNEALKNAPRERYAQIRTNAEIEAKKKAYKEKHGTDMPNGDVKKAGQRSLSRNRDAVGSVSRSKRNIKITDREWEAIQAGAVSENILKQILNNTDTDRLRDLATPKTRTTVSQAQINRIKSLQNSGYSLGQIADKLNISTSTVSKYLKGEN